MINRKIFLSLYDDCNQNVDKDTSLSKVGKNLQIIGKIFDASASGVPGRRLALHMSSIGFLHARSQSFCRKKHFNIHFLKLQFDDPNHILV